MPALTKYSEVRPEASLTPPPKMVVDVLCTWGVVDRPWVFVEAIPFFRTVFPLSQPPTFVLFDILDV